MFRRRKTVLWPSPAMTKAKGFRVDPHRLTAADDAWVGFLAISEQLQNPSLSAEQQEALLRDLADYWRSFLSQSEPIARQFGAYMVNRR